MLPGVLTVWIGALLFVAGVLFMAAQALWRGRLSGPGQSRPGAASDTLEPQPRERSGGFGLKANWPGIILVVVGAILLLAGAAI